MSDSTSRYLAASVKINVEVEAYERDEDALTPDRISQRRPWRKVTLSFDQIFRTDDDLDAAIEAFGASIREAARR